jgi:hypothetical protein
MRRHLWAVVICLFIVAPVRTRGQDKPAAAAAAAAKGEFSLTVYSMADPATFDPQSLARRSAYEERFRPPGYAVVRERRKIDLKSGENVVRFTDVASGIDPTTVAFRSLTDADAYVAEQDYQFDLVSGDKMLEKYLDREVHVDMKGSGAEGRRALDGKLLAADDGLLTLLAADGSVSVIQRGEVTSITLAKSDDSLITKPTLVWRVNTRRAGAHDVQVAYQTYGMTWRADYNITLNKTDTAANVAGWVTLVNQSGAAYPDAQLKLVAGDVHRLPRAGGDNGGQGLFGGSGGGGGRREAEGFKEQSFFEYHLYTLGRRTTVSQNATKQIELFPTRAGVPVEKRFVYYGLPEEVRYWFTAEPNTDRDIRLPMNRKVDVYVAMDNTEKNGMGIPLPAGRVRVSKRDEADQSLEFVGEDVIQHTPKDEPTLFRIGSAFDIVGERRQTSFEAEWPKWMDETFEIKLRNHKTEVVKVIVKENLFRWLTWEITESSDKWEKVDYRTIHIPVEVPAGGEKVVTYKVRYTR